MSSQNAFHIAGAYGLNNLVKVLLMRAKDIDPDRQDKEGRTPLSWATARGHTEVVKALLSDGRVDPEQQDNYGQTPLSWLQRMAI
jgi:ankyrin repeat protein